MVQVNKQNRSFQFTIGDENEQTRWNVNLNAVKTPNLLSIQSNSPLETVIAHGNKLRKLNLAQYDAMGVCYVLCVKNLLSQNDMETLFAELDFRTQ